MAYVPTFFEPVRKLLKWEKVAIDNFVFRLHYKVTTIMFLGLVVLVTAKQHFGDFIDCHVDASVQPILPKVMNSWCWLTGTYTVQYDRQEDENACLREHSQYICRINPPYRRNGVPVLTTKVYHNYYQWVSWVIFVQVVMFNLPRILWKSAEGGKVKFLTDQSPKTLPLNQDEKDKRAERMYTAYNVYCGRNNLYAYQFFICEILNLFNVIANIYMVDSFLSGQFFNYGSRILQSYFMGTTDDPMGDVFPKVSMCAFDKYATGGSKMKVENMCVLSLNIINDKVYLLMWIWLWFLLAVTALNVFYRIVIVVTPWLRTLVLWQGAKSGEWNVISSVSVNMPIGDWFLLRQMSKNVDEMTFVSLIEKLYEEKSGYVKDAEKNRFATMRLETNFPNKAVIKGLLKGETPMSKAAFSKMDEVNGERKQTISSDDLMTPDTSDNASSVTLPVRDSPPATPKAPLASMPNCNPFLSDQPTEAADLLSTQTASEMQELSADSAEKKAAAHQQVANGDLKAGNECLQSGIGL